MIATERTEALRHAAFTGDPRAGNPAGVVLDASRLDDGAMLAIGDPRGHVSGQAVRIL